MAHSYRNKCYNIWKCGSDNVSARNFLTFFLIVKVI